MATGEVIPATEGSDAAPTDITPTVYDETVMESASGVVEYLLEGDSPYVSDPHYRYVGVGIVQEVNEHGFMDFWITLYFADCLTESPNVTGTPTGTQHPLATLTTTDPPTPIPTLTPIAESTPTPVASLVSLDSYDNGRWLERRDRQLATTIKDLEWVRDGIGEEESEVVQDLLYIAATSRSVAASILSLGWIQDGVQELEAGVIDWLNNVGSADVASKVVSLTWLKDGIEDNELKAVEQISYIDYGDPEVASLAVSLAWVEDGIDENELKALEEFAYIVGSDAEVASLAISLAWVEDGIDENELKALEEFAYIVDSDAEVASLAISLNWVEDGIEPVEVELIEAIASIVYISSDEALRIVGMSFLETIEPYDVSAMKSLRQLAAFNPEGFDRVMSHVGLSNGISDETAPIVATLDGVTRTNPGLVDVLLDTSRILIERRDVILPLSGYVVLDIIRTAPGAAKSMDLLEHSVRGVEKYMGVPLPTRYVNLLFADAVSGSSAGTNFGTHIAVLPEFDVDDDSHEAQFSGFAIAHEVAHYYWSGNRDWVDEGAADLMASIIEGARTDRQFTVTNPPCAYADNIVELESLQISEDGPEFDCNYSLGERLFVELHLTLGDEVSAKGSAHYIWSRWSKTTSMTLGERR